jgi:hypothetical protein
LHCTRYFIAAFYKFLNSEKTRKRLKKTELMKRLRITPDDFLSILFT